MNAEAAELDELFAAISDAGDAFEASANLREQLAALGCHVSIPAELWREVVRARRLVEAGNLAVLEYIRAQARRSMQ